MLVIFLSTLQAFWVDDQGRLRHSGYGGQWSSDEVLLSGLEPFVQPSVSVGYGSSNYMHVLCVNADGDADGVTYVYGSGWYNLFTGASITPSSP